MAIVDNIFGFMLISTYLVYFNMWCVVSKLAEIKHFERFELIYFRGVVDQFGPNNFCLFCVGPISG